MLFAFCALAMALGGLSFAVLSKGNGIALPAILAFASASFAGAGIFPLGSTSEIHVVLVAAAFVACGLGMYLLPSTVPEFSTSCNRFTSYGLLGVLAFSVAIGHRLIPMGIGQRAAAISLLIWIVVFGFKLILLRDAASNTARRLG
jgi:hypothetical protein